MYYLKYIVAFHLFVSCYAAGEVEQAFLDSGIVPNIEIVAPTRYLNVTYRTVSVDLGNRINPLQTITEPDVSYEGNNQQLYTLIMTGPDLPLDLTPRYTQVLHWMVVNIQGTDIETGVPVSPYFPPVPYPGGFKYLFLIYEQNEFIETEPLERYSEILNRPGFDVVEFKEQHGLTGPVAGNFMREVYLPPISIDNAS